MMKLLIVLAALVATSLASPTCDDLTAVKTKAQWSRAYSHGHSREHFAVAIFRSVFNLSPSFKERLEKAGSEDTNSGAFRAFALRAVGDLDIAITFVNKPEALKAQIAYHDKLYASLQITDEETDHFFEALSYVVPAQLGRCFDRESWNACMSVIRDSIKNKAHEKDEKHEVGHH